MVSIRDFSRKKKHTVFVLGGGGNMGAMQVGMLRALHNAEIVPDTILGCSVGALNGAAYAADPTEHGLNRLEELWNAIARDERQMMPSSRLPSPVQIMRKGESLHSNEQLGKLIDDFLNHKPTFEELAIDFQCVAADIESACETWFSEGDLSQPLVASAAIPGVYPIVEIEGRKYLDGGIVANVPIARAVALGAKRIVVCHVGLNAVPDTNIRRPIDAALLGYWIARNARFQRDIESIPRSVDVMVLPVGDRMHVSFDDFSRGRELIAQGYEQAQSYLESLESSEGSTSERLALEVRRLGSELRQRVSTIRSSEPMVDDSEPLRELVEQAAREEVDDT